VPYEPFDWRSVISARTAQLGKKNKKLHTQYLVVALEPASPLKGGSLTFRGRFLRSVGTDAQYSSLQPGLNIRNSTLDPCSPELQSLKDKEFIKKLIVAHPMFMYTPADASEAIVAVQRGDMFLVTLGPSYGPYDVGLQGAITVVSRYKMRSAMEPLRRDAACMSLEQLFADEDAITLAQGAGEIGALNDDEILQCAAKYDASDPDKIPYKSQNNSIIGKLHTSFQPHVKCFIFKCYEDGIKIKMTSAYRDIEKQTKMLDDWLAKPESDRGIRPAPGGSSYHNYGLAFDFNAFRTYDGASFTSSTTKVSWEASGIPEIGKSLGLRWGGDFSTNYDPIHFDAGDISGVPRTNVLYGKAKVQKVAGNQVVIA